VFVVFVESCIYLALLLLFLVSNMRDIVQHYVILLLKWFMKCRVNIHLIAMPGGRSSQVLMGLLGLQWLPRRLLLFGRMEDIFCRRKLS